MSVVMKFGGTSVADAEAIGRVTAIVRGQMVHRTSSDRAPVVVVSALSKVTDGLIRTSEFARAGDAEKAAAFIERYVRAPATQEEYLEAVGGAATLDRITRWEEG